MLRSNRKWIVLVGLGILALAFLFLNFHASVSNTRAEHQVQSSSMGDQLPDAMLRRDAVTLVITGEGPLVQALEKSLPAELRKAGLNEIRVVRELEAAYPNPVLIVNVDRPGVFWTPLFGTSQFTVKAGYASNGDTTFMGQKVVTYDNANGPVLNMSGEFKLSDRTWGLLSRPAYYQLLADGLARSIAEAAQNIYKAKS